MQTVDLSERWPDLGLPAQIMDVLQHCKSLGLDRIVAQSVPEKRLGVTIMDRPREASSLPQRASQSRG